ncbi:MAG: VWA domain-containing protein, partial [Fastidiosipila sp.]|nr:VWA domain-containing protein [Fastidiosipila sp.]
MKRLMKNFAILIALFLLLGTVGIDVQVAASSLQNELSATDTITGDETEETKPEALEPKASESEPTEPEPTESTEPTEPTEPEATEPTEPEVTEPSEPEVTEPTETKPTEPKEPAPSETEPEDLKEEKPDDPIAVEYAEDPAPWMYGSPRRSMGLLSNGTPSTRVVDPTQVAENQLQPGQVRMTKTVAPVPGLVNTWDITLRVAGRPEQVTSDIVLVIDVSGSMGFSIPSMPQDRLYYTKEAARNFVDTVLGADPLNTRISIVSFSGPLYDGTVNTAIERLAFSNNASSLKTAINNLSVAGGSTQYTHTQSGIARARQVLGSSIATKKTIVLFSDGLPNRNYRINSPTAADFYTGSSASDRLSRRDLAMARFDYNYSVSDNSNIYISGTQYRYSSPNSAIAEGAIARSAGYTIYAIGMYAGTEGQATLNLIASPGKSYDSDAAGLNTVFQEIAGQLGSPVSTATITDPMASGFIIDDTGTIVKTSGNANYNAGTKTLTWDFPLLSQSGTGDIKYEQLTYRIVITEDTPYVTGNTLLPTNGTTAMNFTDVAGQESINNFLIPEVDPVFVTLDKVLLDGSGSPISSTKDFTITLDGVNYLINADDPIKVVKKVWNVGNYQVSETAEPDYITSYEVNGVATQQLTLA